MNSYESGKPHLALFKFLSTLKGVHVYDTSTAGEKISNVVEILRTTVNDCATIWNTTTSVPFMGVCSLCLTPETLVKPAHRFVSKNFTDWDKNFPQKNPEGVFGFFWCHTCVWVYRSPLLRKEPFLLILNSSDNFYITCSQNEIVSHLLQQGKREKWGERWAFSYPKGSSKHTMPYTEWFHISSKKGVTLWSAKETQTLQIIIELYKLGVNVMSHNFPEAVYKDINKKNHETVHRINELVPQLKMLNFKNNPQKSTITYLATSVTQTSTYT